MLTSDLKLRSKIYFFSKRILFSYWHCWEVPALVENLKKIFLVGFIIKCFAGNVHTTTIPTTLPLVLHWQKVISISAYHHIHQPTCVCRIYSPFLLLVMDELPLYLRSLTQPVHKELHFLSSTQGHDSRNLTCLSCIIMSLMDYT